MGVTTQSVSLQSINQVKMEQLCFDPSSVNPQLSLTESEISKIGTIKVEGIINPTNAEMDLKDGVGEKDTFMCILFLINNL